MASTQGKERGEDGKAPQADVGGGGSLQRARSLYAELKRREKYYRISEFNWNRKDGKYIPQQQELIQEFVDRLKTPVNDRRNVYLYQGGNRAGKCHRAGDKVIMHDMTVKAVEDVKAGDVLMGPDGTPRNVLVTCGGYGKLYEVKPQRHAPFYVNGEHIMAMVERRRSKKGVRKDAFRFVTVNEWNASSKRSKHEKKLKLGGGFDLKERPHEIPPYMLGLWLGDGSRGNGAITTADPEVEDYVRKYAESIGYGIRKESQEGNRSSTYNIVRPDNFHEGFIGKLRRVGLGVEKFIPNEYLDDSLSNRLSLLAGLIDTDGWSQNNQFCFCSTDHKLAEGAHMLACSVGFAATIHKRVAKLKRPGMPTYEVDCWTVAFAAVPGITVPCLISRKIPKGFTTVRDPRYTKPEIREIGEGRYYGFELDGDHLYMTDNWVIQHNTAAGAFLVACMALDSEWKRKLKLPEVGKEDRIMILTKSGVNVKDVIEPYLLGDGSITRLPPDVVDKVHRDNGILKTIHLKDGTVITVGTYDAGYEIAQGKSPGFVWLDEEPLDGDVMQEAFARTLTMGAYGDSCKLLMTMSPLNGPSTPAMEWFENPPGNFGRFTRKWLVSMLDNPWANKNAADMFKGHDYQQRILGLAVNPTGLVYHEFRRERNVIPHFDPTQLGYGTRYYAGIDFGVSHPTAIIVLAVDDDGNHYVFDTWKKSNASLKEIAEQYKQMTKLYDLEYGVGDSAALRERHELNLNYGIKLQPVDKFSKGENGESNRRAGIFLVNQLMSESKFMVSDRCKDLIKEIENHYYKDSEKDGSVVKEKDDLVDTVRYLCSTIRKDKNGKNERDFKRKYGVSSKAVVLGHNGNAGKITIRY